MFRRILLVVLVLGIIAANRPEPRVARAKTEPVRLEDEMNDISGYYSCKGREASGKTYSGIAVITRQNDLYMVQWMIGPGAGFTGVGIRQGNTLATSWAIPNDKGGLIRGVNLYKIESGPRLTGRWASIPGPGVLQTETLTFLKRVEKDED
jgi:hypothetical protein